ncbi:MAG: hypothetical protein ACLGP3_07310 [Acidobacteriota bacterium]
MRPQTIGRALGVGLRVAGRMAGQYIAGPEPARRAGAAAVSGAGSAGSGASSVRSSGQAAGRVAAQASRGVGGFLKPFGRVGGIVWLEVTGVFFLLPVLVFAPKIWQTRASWAQGPDHRLFVASAIIVAVFLYLGISSFWRAHKRSAAGR